MTNQNDWSAEEDAALRSAWLAGKSSKACAADLPDRSPLPARSPSACIGRAKRIGLPKRNNNEDLIGRKLRSAAQKNKVRPPSGLPRTKPADQQMIYSEAVPFVDLPIEESGCAVGVLDVGPKQCRWPLGDPRSAEFKFCGADGYPWCEKHLLKVYQLPNVRKAEFEVEKPAVESKTVLEGAE